MAPGESRQFHLTLEVLVNRNAVAAAEKAVAELRQGVTPIVCPQLAPGWSEM